METKNIPALLAALFFILSLLLYFGVVPAKDGKPTDTNDSLKNLCLTIPQTEDENFVNGFIIDNNDAINMTKLYNAKKGSYKFEYSGVYVSNELIQQLIVLNDCKIPHGYFLSYGAEADPNDPSKLITTYILSVDTAKKDRDAVGYKDSQTQKNRFITAKINNGTSLCPARCFEPIQ